MPSTPILSRNNLAKSSPFELNDSRALFDEKRKKRELKAKENERSKRQLALDEIKARRAAKRARLDSNLRTKATVEGGNSSLPEGKYSTIATHGCGFSSKLITLDPMWARVKEMQSVQQRKRNPSTKSPSMEVIKTRKRKASEHDADESQLDTKPSSDISRKGSYLLECSNHRLKKVKRKPISNVQKVAAIHNTRNPDEHNDPEADTAPSTAPRNTTRLSATENSSTPDNSDRSSSPNQSAPAKATVSTLSSTTLHPEKPMASRFPYTMFGIGKRPVIRTVMGYKNKDGQIKVLHPGHAETRKM